MEAVEFSQLSPLKFTSPLRSFSMSLIALSFCWSGIARWGNLVRFWGAVIKLQRKVFLGLSASPMQQMPFLAGWELHFIPNQQWPLSDIQLRNPCIAVFTARDALSVRGFRGTKRIHVGVIIHQLCDRLRALTMYTEEHVCKPFAKKMLLLSDRFVVH